MRGNVLPVAAVALMLGGCSGAIDKLSDFSPRVPDLSISNLELNPYSKASMSVATTFQLPPVPPADFVNADGSCAAVDTGADQPAAATNVGLQMTECAVVRAMGAPERTEIVANERSERLVKLTYTRGDRAGLYVFTAGRLTDIQRLAEAAPPPKPQRQPAKPRRTTG